MSMFNNGLFMLGANLEFTLFQVLVCAPSNVAVDQLADKISSTGLKVWKFILHEPYFEIRLLYYFQENLV